jgi:hypothetical protein
MKVKELIERLQELDPTNDIVVNVSENDEITTYENIRVESYGTVSQIYCK